MHTVQHILAKRPGPVVTIDPRATVLEAAKLMNAHHIGALPVTRGDKVIGIITERDVLNRVVAAQKSPAETEVREAMTTPVACCRSTTTEAECRAVMRAKRIRHLPVVDDGRLLGVIAIGDIIEDENEQKDETIHYLHEYLYGGHR